MTSQKKELIKIEVSIETKDNNIERLSKEVEIDVYWENNKFSSKNQGEKIFLEKGSDKFPVIVTVEGVEKSLTSSSYIGGNCRVEPALPNTLWKVKEYRVDFPSQSRHFTGLVFGIIGVLFAVSILGVVGWYLWKRKSK